MVYGVSDTVLEKPPEGPEYLEQGLALQLALIAAPAATSGCTAPETGRAYARAHELSQQMGESPEVITGLLNLGVFCYARGEC